MKRKAFTLVEIMFAVGLCCLVLGVVYKVFSGTFSMFIKTTNKMTNLRAASIILERLKNDVRCSVVPVIEEEQPLVEDIRLSFYTTSDGERKKVTYEFNGKEIVRNFSGNTRSISKALVKKFSIVPSEESKGNKYITVTIVVDNEQNYSSRSTSSKANEVELQAVLYPRFYTESLTDEEKFWYKTREDS